MNMLLIFLFYLSVKTPLSKTEEYGLFNRKSQIPESERSVRMAFEPHPISPFFRNLFTPLFSIFDFDRRVPIRPAVVTTYQEKNGFITERDLTNNPSFSDIGQDEPLTADKSRIGKKYARTQTTHSSNHKFNKSHHNKFHFFLPLSPRQTANILGRTNSSAEDDIKESIKSVNITAKTNATGLKFSQDFNNQTFNITFTRGCFRRFIYTWTIEWRSVMVHVIIALIFTLSVTLAMLLCFSLIPTQETNKEIGSKLSKKKILITKFLNV